MSAVISRVNGPIVEVSAGEGVAMLDLVYVGRQRLPGEVIALEGETATVQVYEYTGGLQPGEEVVGSGGPLTVELGPGLVGGVFDGVLRRLDVAGERIEAGAATATLDRDRMWKFSPTASLGEHLDPGSIIGTVQESAAIEHRILVPAGVVGGKLDWIAAEGEYQVADPIARIGDLELGLSHQWPVRRSRPSTGRLSAGVPLVTGQRVLDLLFPVARGSTAAVPGGFGTGKTVLLQQIAKWCDADVIVYVGCGERGNEMAELLHDFQVVEDPRTGQSLLDRTVLIANTSNMPVMAREASVYTGVTVAEYYRDMGHDAVVIADSTSRWAEALRERGARTDELPAEEGYPAGLSSAIAEFYERAGRVRTLGGGTASVTILGAVSPPGGDLTEPVTAHTRRFVRSVWSLDRDLAYARHNPAISWHDSSSRDAEQLAIWQAEHGDPEWGPRRISALRLLNDSDRIEQVAQLVGADSLPPTEQVTLRTARILREVVLQQSSSLDNDQYSTLPKQRALLELALRLHDRLIGLVESGVEMSKIDSIDLSPLQRIRFETGPDAANEVDRIARELFSQLESLEVGS